jgi:hypothetical protein
MNNFVSLTPSDHLVFQLFHHKSVNNSLEIKNTSPNPITFKIKTTSPARYLVKPSQGVVNVDETKVVNIGIVPKEVSAIVSQGLENCSDKFLVQTKPIGEPSYNEAVALDPEKQNDFIGNFWTNDPANVARQKIQVRFLPPNDVSPTIQELAERSEQIKGEVKGSERDTDISSMNSNSDYQALQKRYENLMSITANMVSEKENLKKIIENLKSELQKESAARIALESQSSEGLRQGRRANKGNDELDSSNKSSSQFSFLTLIIVAVISLLFGRML